MTPGTLPTRYVTSRHVAPCMIKPLTRIFSRRQLLTTTRYSRIEKRPEASIVGNDQLTIKQENAPNLTADAVKMKTEASLVEDGLRKIMNRNDLDVLFDNPMDDQSSKNILPLLQQLCYQLDQVVNTALLVKSPTNNKSDYGSLENLLRVLDTSTIKFVMITGKGHRLFLPSDLKSTLEGVDAFNSFLDRLTQPDLTKIPIPGSEEIVDEERSGCKGHIHETIRSLRILLAWIKKLAHCQDSHNVLLRLPEWDTSSYSEREQSYADLYLSTPCHRPFQWQETRLQHFVEKNEDWYLADHLCDDINDSYERPEKLDIGVCGDEIHVYYGDAEPTEETQTLKSLRYLLESNPLQSRFQDFEKRAIAASLVLGLTLASETENLIKFWDPKSIFFLLDVNGKSISKGPYALCIPPADNNLHFPNHKEATEADAGSNFDDRFRILARMLLEIECGRPLDYLRIHKDPEADPEGTTLDNFIDEQWTEDLGRLFFYKALKNCSSFDQKCRSLITTGRSSGEAEAARTLVYEIVKDLHKQVEYTTKDIHYTHAGRHFEHTSSKDMPITVSSELEHLGFANPVAAAASSTLVTSTQGSNPRSRSKGVRFAEDDVLIKPIEIDPVQLFSDGDEQQNYGEIALLCKSSRAWVKDFKRLRKDKIGTQAKERIKVAVLDTGIDLRHPDFSGLIKGQKCCVEGSTIQDTSGHGTHIAGIIRDLTINVDLYIIKVVESRESQDRAGIVEGLRQARKWGVDMISLSFGFRRPDSPDLVQKQIKKCLRENILVFASASNDAGNRPRTYPGNYNDVFCIHSADGGGNSSKFNPSPEPRKQNFSFVGDCVRSSWPWDREDFHDEQGAKYLSGTSIATPVAVAVAAFMRAYITKHLGEYEWDIEPAHSEGMREILWMMSHKREGSEGGYDWVSPRYFFEKHTDEQVKADLKSVLRAWKR